jgi:DNA-binding SARP family transcriptional activator
MPHPVSASVAVASPHRPRRVRSPLAVTLLSTPYERRRRWSPGLVSPTSPACRLTLLGGFEASFGGDPLTVASPGQRLLAMLAVTPRRSRAPRQALAERLWADLPAERAGAQLRSVLWRLPRPRGRSYVVADATGVRLADDVRVDLWDAEEVALRPFGETDAMPDRTELTLLGRDLLPTWHDAWLDVERESFRQRRLHALERAASSLRRAGRYTDALSVALAAVQSEPLRESAHRSVIEVHLVEGNHAEALRQFHSYRRLIATELGIPPSPAIRRLVGPLLGRPID